jgi:hypothetical protein
MKYSKGYKEKVEETFSIQTPITPKNYIELWDVSLTPQGRLTIRKGFACDGASGPTFDTKNAKVPAFCHDALYKLMRKKLLPASWRPEVDLLLYRMLIERKMWKIRAKLWLRAVQKFGVDSATKPRKVYEVF